ncbi:MAG: lactococcin family bacteriocin [Lactococcus lactis]|nr:lactococcin family bacteriocin [Lactococcus lactis]
MENQTNFEVVSDEELSKINGGVALELTREGYYNQYGGHFFMKTVFVRILILK